MVLEIDRCDGVTTLTLNRPQALNALNLELISALRAATVQIESDAATRVVVLRGGGEHFMAGGDLRWFSEQLHLAAEDRRQLFMRIIGDVQASILSLRRMGKPVLGSVRGAAAGFGLSLVLACDLAIAADSAYFTLAYRHLGLSPDGGVTWMLPRVVGHKRAAAIAFLGDRFDAQAALELGLVNRVVPDAELEAATNTLARRLAAGPRLAIAQTKALLERALYTDLATQLELEQVAFAACASQADFDAGLAAFFGKRPPAFS